MEKSSKTEALINQPKRKLGTGTELGDSDQTEAGPDVELGARKIMSVA